MHVIAERNLRTVDLNLLVVFDALMAEPGRLLNRQELLRAIW